MPEAACRLDKPLAHAPLVLTRSRRVVHESAKGEVQRRDTFASGHVSEYVVGVLVVKDVQEPEGGRAPDLDRPWRRAAREGFLEDVRNVQRRSSFAIPRSAERIEARLSNRALEPEGLHLLERGFTSADPKHDLHERSFLRFEELPHDLVRLLRREAWHLQQCQYLVCEFSLSRRKRRDVQPVVESIAHIAVDHRAADGAEFIHAPTETPSSRAHRRELVRWDRHSASVPRPAVGGTERTACLGTWELDEALAHPPLAVAEKLTAKRREPGGGRDPRVK